MGEGEGWREKGGGEGRMRGGWGVKGGEKIGRGGAEGGYGVVFAVVGVSKTPDRWRID